jgi:hypothetical protein
MRELTKKHAWSTLPAGATLLNGTLMPVNGFTAKCAEITNFEYHTFLNDLLVQDDMKITAGSAMIGFRPVYTLK